MGLDDFFSPLGKVIDENIVPDVIGRSEEDPASIDAGQFVDEALHIIVLAEHEGIDRNAVTRAALHLLERFE